uniref:Chromatin modification-related protein EAF7-like n=1 Tax=Nicotiana sylvestris TaxID=4096 RepID=A0A1U7W2V2_NICSY|nr:PREDICTED: chromatin modification-related protein EAF7-like [Nicotiana sylvestris]
MEPLTDTKEYYDSAGNKAPAIPQDTIYEKQKIHDLEIRWGSPNQLTRLQNDYAARKEGHKNSLENLVIWIGYTTESGERKEGEIEEQQGEHVGDLKGEEKESEGEDNYEGEGNEEEKESKVMALLEEVHEDEGSEELMSSLTPFVEDEEVESDEDDLPLYEVGKKNMKAHAKPTRTTSHARKEVAPPTRTPLTRN